ncbi:hypothetical protein DFH27DRAFT_58098 [Peziza echinospora]|nr:hypothetical protein DFH27DRAFT_58098 [Peziza echinospora]
MVSRSFHRPGPPPRHPKKNMPAPPWPANSQRRKGRQASSQASKGRARNRAQGVARARPLPGRPGLVSSVRTPLGSPIQDPPACACVCVGCILPVCCLLHNLLFFRSKPASQYRRPYGNKHLRNYIPKRRGRAFFLLSCSERWEKCMRCTECALCCCCLRLRCGRD